MKLRPVHLATDPGFDQWASVLVGAELQLCDRCVRCNARAMSPLAAYCRWCANEIDAEIECERKASNQ